MDFSQRLKKTAISSALARKGETELKENSKAGEVGKDQSKVEGQGQSSGGDEDIKDSFAFEAYKGDCPVYLHL